MRKRKEPYIAGATDPPYIYVNLLPKDPLGIVEHSFRFLGTNYPDVGETIEVRRYFDGPATLAVVIKADHGSILAQALSEAPGATDGRPPEVLRAVDVEETILRAFIRKTRVERHVALLRTPTRRAKLIAQFYDLDLDPRFVYGVPAESQGAKGLYEFLRACRAPDSCYVMSADSELDGREMDLREALELTVNHDSGTLISCIPGRLAYYEGDDSCRFILQREAT